MVLYVATGNAGKIRDFSLAAQHVGELFGSFTFERLPGLDAIAAPEEDQDSFEGNAKLKAVYYSRHAPGLLVLCDDSGLEVDALGGSPGVRSAYFADDVGFGHPSQSADQNNNELLLLEMTEQTQRSAHYRCVLALAQDGRVLHTAEGNVAGTIATEPAGNGGFGYDPLFFLPGEGCTMAQVAPEHRLRLSHRGRALRSLLAKLATAA